MSSNTQVNDSPEALIALAQQAQAEHDAQNAPPDLTPEADPPAPEEPKEAPKEPQAEPKATEGLEIEKKAVEAVSEAFDMDSLYTEYAEKGELSEETRSGVVERLEKAGFKDASGLLDRFIAGAVAQAQVVQNTVFESVGGEQTYRDMIAWAQSNLSDEDIDNYNEAIKDPKMVRLAVAGLHSQFARAQGDRPSTGSPRVAAGQTTFGGGEPITSLQQVARITADPRYDSDPGFRAQQDARIEASMKAGYLK